ncbi:hypothetical protein [Antarctobacter sp.]|uniref:hypothetical protein n=1 Tax=Antarctobacter sp. TaxID=1872577 RepID=UPI003A8EFAC1
MILEGAVKFTVYLDQNILGHLFEGESAKEDLLRVLEQFRERGAAFVYSDVHVEECQAFFRPEKYIRVLDEIDACYIQPTERLEKHFAIKSNMAGDLIKCEPDFASKSLTFLSSLMTVSQFALGWLGELEAEELMRELEVELDLWIEELSRETYGLCDTAPIRQQLLASLLSLDVKALKKEGLAQQPQTDSEWNKRFSRIDELPTEDVANFIFGEIGSDAAQHLRGLFPSKIWPDGVYVENGTLTGLAFFLFTQGVGRDRKVKSGGQSNRRKRFQSQFRDCRHIENAARCDVFISNDRRAINLAQATYAYSGVKTIAKYVKIRGSQ